MILGQELDNADYDSDSSGDSDSDHSGDSEKAGLRQEISALTRKVNEMALSQQLFFNQNFM